MMETCNFHGLALFYKRFIWNFSTIMRLVTECLKGGAFNGQKLQERPSLTLENHDNSSCIGTTKFSKTIYCWMRCLLIKIGVVLSQERKPIVFFSGKLLSKIAITRPIIEMVHILLVFLFWICLRFFYDSLFWYIGKLRFYCERDFDTN